jgi:hypothetical protein
MNKRLEARARGPVFWFLMLDEARERGDGKEAAQARRELRRLGLKGYVLAQGATEGWTIPEAVMRLRPLRLNYEALRKRPCPGREALHGAVSSQTHRKPKHSGVLFPLANRNMIR